MTTGTHTGMLGVTRQPPCGKCCGERTKRANASQKRAERRHSRQQFRIDVAAGRY
ncbi:hypothetical protein [Mycolicibacter kumamotonensis]|uniref:hypothetical protein n=1 Tax=Mycolicibacter kumamotonensis TaxID=354243 RepID=UPI0013F4BE7C|nr:hypothetical protein [Mycolicibacter kumamotonensis]